MINILCINQVFRRFGEKDNPLNKFIFQFKQLTKQYTFELAILKNRKFETH